jgi:8-oxo-dGTP pyrophosphatase MutT (NUDIX family)
MLLYLPTFAAGHPLVDAAGLTANGAPFRPLSSIDDANAAARAPDGAKGRILVLDGAALADPAAPRHIPRRAVLNVDADGDYWRPVPVVAAGGHVLRRAPDGGVEVLVIHRRGVWDLPKGKLDEGETVQEAAVREVAEEVGIPESSLRVLGPLPDTLHGYFWPSRSLYALKTTHWFAMTTTAERFKPQKSEAIEKVKWMAWGKAAAKMGFPTLRAQMAALDPDALGV